MTEEYGYDYFERGLAAGISLYENYRWIPELTIPLAMTYIDYLRLTREDEILDFGCAKGYVVKALRMLHRKAWGCDLSKYAIIMADPETKQYLKQSYEEKAVPFIRRFDWIIAKDVLEHIEESKLPSILRELREFSYKMFAIIPLGEDGKFNVPAYNMDKTHKTAHSLEWWKKTFKANKWYVDSACLRVQGIKDNWADYADGNGFFILL